MCPFNRLTSGDTMLSPGGPRRRDSHVSLVETYQPLLLHGARHAAGSVVACTRAGSAASSAAGAATAATATPQSAATPAAGRADCALPRCVAGTGPDGIDLSA